MRSNTETISCKSELVNILYLIDYISIATQKVRKEKLNFSKNDLSYNFYPSIFTFLS